ncbi:SCO family protein [Pinisolibacter sp.]|uniref:SCO family protein n=1 Tax=Pinisolibacter sp. TaxID=2172024 RepID=UPI002FDE4D1E
MASTRRAVLGVLATATLFATLSPAFAGQRILGIDQTGKPVPETLQTGWRLVYFGYTFCPDVCPLGLQTMAEALDLLGPFGEKLTPIFVTVDPDRDKPEVMAGYVTFFHPRLVGVTPTTDELQQMAKAWRVKYAKVDVGEGRPYLMDHTAAIFIVDPDGNVVGRLSHNLAAARMAEKIRSVLEARS